MTFGFRHLIALCLSIGLSLLPLHDAIACAAPRIFSDVQLQSPETGKIGVVGKVIGTYPRAKNRESGETVVRIKVTESYGKDAPKSGAEIFILNPGCCVCVGIDAYLGADAKAILVGSIEAPYRLAW